MDYPVKHYQELRALPPVLRQLLDAELAAGNSIREITFGLPAPPSGACVRLALPVSTRARRSGDGLEYSGGQFTDHRAHYFLLEPPSAEQPAAGSRSGPSTVVRRFEKSMEMNYEKWHDGIG